ncbi:amino acid ABC transporter substrate-binding protein [Accumulibacter sp.]|uniref:amino acid ABC transporter substrate-binding protein n=1 Tax=Accumulibacter sp. TaxID=2053492 RepID=UPI002BCFF54B|nr:amino acid ABC transporter substrate-binding protein [Accumulibacter sp.]HNB69442.1 amino acid ABC transporter substrate-binding protein [Accumulibacter sp.]HNE41290.1 amino acid ABC transporter substrate-binding protein [Accumulibacter sp.]HNG17127.1 amino acid ABC transporter substrate-binding protein [Accumulibacter sp.]HNH93577.1 amino acid ABC transporter substrate-binding protein [Accumulibacter sp.]HNJ51623.1 amino acid ABC transporter substrate-binding protein [Accumulibacter sp.]
MFKQKTLCRCLAALTLGVAAGSAFAGPTLDAIKQRGTLVCGVHTGLTGFSAPDKTGKYAGIDVDYCKALAAAILGSADKVKYVPLTAQQRFTALQSGEIDLLSRNTTWNSKRDTTMGSVFPGVWFYDGQAFVINSKKNPKVKKLADLNKASVCVETGTTTERNMADYARANKLSFKPVVFEGQEATEKAFQSGRCDAYTTDASGIAAMLVNLPNRSDYTVLPEIISKEPLAPMLRRNDQEFFAIARWTIFALQQAEESGVTQANVLRMKAESKDPAVQRLTGATGEIGKGLGLDADWAVRALQAVGNYGESFERNIKPLGLARGMNALWNKGGLMYPMPLD